MAWRELHGKHVLVTGASSGIGREICKALVKRGAIVLATARRLEKLSELESECSAGSLKTFPGDITQPEHRSQLVSWIETHWGKLDILINNAGVGAIGNFADASEERLRSLMEVDFFAPVELTRRCIPLLKKGDRPAILNIGSVLAHRAVPGKSEYCAAKFALRGWSEALRVELAPLGIDLLMLSPSTTRSEFFDVLVDTDPAQTSRSMGSMSPEQVAQAALSQLTHSKRERVLSLGGKILVWAGHWFPGTLDRVLGLHVERNSFR